MKGETPCGPFKYWDKGTMATIGRARAVAETNGFRFSGYLAWLAWLFVHIMYLARSRTGCWFSSSGSGTT